MAATESAESRPVFAASAPGVGPDDPAIAAPLHGQTWLFVLPDRTGDGYRAIRRGPEEIEEVVVDEERARQLADDDHARECRVIDTPAWPEALQDDTTGQ